MAYQAPISDMLFVLNDLHDFAAVVDACACEDASADLVEAILEEGGKLAAEVIAPLNHSGDMAGVTLDGDGRITTPAGFKEAYQAFVDGGWGGIQFGSDYEGQGLPFALATPIQEMIHAANMAWGLCPLLTQGAVEAIEQNASAALKEKFLPNMVSARWSGTMNLTEPQAGSDLSNIRTTAKAEGDHYLIQGQKCFITWGEHDMAENIVHLVLARLPGAPEGVRGISLFLVPKIMVNADGSLGEANDCRVLSIEHKMGIHASPTCVMSFGDNGGAVGYLVGAENRGLACMFTMMNNARLTVGLQGVSISERAYQHALAYSQERVQGVAPGFSEPGPIIRHPDVRRMLLLMRSLTEAGRALAYLACREVDLAKHVADPDALARHQRRLDLLTPLVKGWCTEMAQEVTALGVQCHGGSGFVEEAGAAQHQRDARILPIYEGTNGIQAMDLVGRKVLRDQGLAMNELLAEMQQDAAAWSGLAAIDGAYVALFGQSLQALEAATATLLSQGEADPNLPGAMAFNYLMLASTVVTSWQMLRAWALVADETRSAHLSEPFKRSKQHTCGFYLAHVLPRYLAYAQIIAFGSKDVMALAEADF
ncbi:acyl-CoA dehydrogenase [Neisseriaceae bacterium CLB008]